MKKKLTSDISATSFQVIINQLCGLLIFYILSATVSKNDFGEINWSLAIWLAIFNILSLGIDQVLVKKVAAGSDPGKMLSLYITHVLLTGGLFYGIILLSQFFGNTLLQQHQVLLWIGFGKLMIFWSTPFKQVATGLEKFRPLLWMAVCSNILRSILLIAAVVSHQVNLTVVIMIFIAGDIAELLLSFFITTRVLKIRLSFSQEKKTYLLLVKESLPQAAVVVCTAALSRFDWILLGILTTNVIVAEYSFAYKVFEVATVPLLIIAPILIPRFTRLFTPGDTLQNKTELFVLFRIEMIIASLAALMICICWEPAANYFTQGRYGTVNRYTIILLCTSMPLLYFNNFLWTIHFAQGRLKMILGIIVITCIINITGNLALIPYWKAEGAAGAYLLAMIAQAVLYFQKTTMPGLQKNWVSVLICPACAIISGSIAMLLFTNPWLLIISSLLFFAITLFVSQQLRRHDWLIFKQVTGL